MTTTQPPPRLDCIALIAEPPKIVPGASERAWMGATEDHFAYRCTPLSIANGSGWEVLTPHAFTAEWTGGDETADVRITPDDPAAWGERAGSVFGHGILTFHPGYVFRTDPGWVVWARGAPNHVKDGIQALDGVVETHWLPFSFTMNWRFTRPGKVRFEAGEPFLFLTLAPATLIESVQPTLSRIEDDQALMNEYALWHHRREQFNAALRAGHPRALAEKWQKNYLHGASPSGGYEAGPDHRIRRRLAEPKTKDEA